MVAIVRYRAGIDRVTGQVLRGKAHLAQSLAVIWLTRTNLRVMLLDFGSDIRSFLSEDITPTMVLSLYNELVTTAHRWEPEYRISNLQLVSLTRTGGLGLRHDGAYYPEGRFENYNLVEPFGEIAAIGSREAVARGRSGAAR